MVSRARLVNGVGSGEVPLASSASSVVSSEDVGISIRAPSSLFELSASSLILLFYLSISSLANIDK